MGLHFKQFDTCLSALSSGSPLSPAGRMPKYTMGAWRPRLAECGSALRICCSISFIDRCFCLSPRYWLAAATLGKHTVTLLGCSWSQTHRCRCRTHSTSALTDSGGLDIDKKAHNDCRQTQASRLASLHATNGTVCSFWPMEHFLGSLLFLQRS